MEPCDRLKQHRRSSSNREPDGNDQLYRNRHQRSLCNDSNSSSNRKTEPEPKRNTAGAEHLFRRQRSADSVRSDELYLGAPCDLKCE